MKKFASLFLALALCMGLAVPAFAAELKSDKYTYTLTLSNEPVGTTKYEDYEGTHTVYLVPDGTTITVMDDTRKLSGVCIWPLRSFIPSTSGTAPLAPDSLVHPSKIEPPGPGPTGPAEA